MIPAMRYGAAATAMQQASRQTRRPLLSQRHRFRPNGYLRNQALRAIRNTFAYIETHQKELRSNRSRLEHRSRRTSSRSRTHQTASRALAKAKLPHSSRGHRRSLHGRARRIPAHSSGRTSRTDRAARGMLRHVRSLPHSAPLGSRPLGKRYAKREHAPKHIRGTSRSAPVAHRALRHTGHHHVAPGSHARRDTHEDSAVAFFNGIPFPRLPNLGNTCYLNSTLQLLLGIPEYSVLLDPAKHTLTRQPREAEGVFEVRRAIQNKLHQLLQKMHSPRTPSREMARLINDIVLPLSAALPPAFNIHRQQDAHEFMNILTERILQKDNLKSQHASKMGSRFTRSVSYRHPSIGPITQEVHDKPTSSIALSTRLPRTGASIQEIIDAYFSEERIADYECEDGVRRTVESRYTLTHPASVLTLALPRFGSTDGGLTRFRQDGPIRELDKPVKMPMDKDGNRFAVYKAERVILHSGSLSGGHYTSATRVGNHWIVSDDSSQPRIASDEEIASKAYTVVYRLIGHETEGRFSPLEAAAATPSLHSDRRAISTYTMLSANKRPGEEHVDIRIPIATVHDLRLNSDRDLEEIFHRANRFTLNTPYPCRGPSGSPSVASMRIEGKEIHRPNHNGTHSIRQVRHLEVLMDLIEKHGSPSAREQLRAFSDSERLNLKLAAYFLRAGRVDESSHQSPPSDDYYTRSALIYEAYATQLGVDTETIQWIKKLIINSCKPLGKRDPTIDSDPKNKLGYELLTLVHELDLVRVFDGHFSRSTLPSIASRLDTLVSGSPSDKDRYKHKLVAFAESLCEATGAPIAYHGNGKARHYDKRKFAHFSLDGKACWRQVATARIPKWS